MVFSQQDVIHSWLRIHRYVHGAFIGKKFRGVREKVSQILWQVVIILKALAITLEMHIGRTSLSFRIGAPLPEISNNE